MRTRSVTDLACTSLLALLLGACATPNPAFLAEQHAAAARDLGIASVGIVALNRCQFARVPLGMSVADFRSGVCALTREAIVLRSLDPTSGQSRPYQTVPFKSVQSISLFTGAITDQIQIRTGDDILAMVMRPDGGAGTNNPAAKVHFDHLVKEGLPVVESQARIGYAQAPGTTYVPIFIPTKK